MKKKIDPSWRGSHLYSPSHVWSFHFCHFLDSSSSVGLLNVGDTQGSVLLTSLFILYSPLDLLIHKHGFTYPWSLRTPTFLALMRLLNWGPLYPLHISNWISSTIFIIFFWNPSFCWNDSINQPVTQTRNLGTLLDSSLFFSFTHLSFSVLPVLSPISH